MPTRLTSNALVVAGIEAVKGAGAANYEVQLAEQASSVEIQSETIEATLINPSFGAAKKIATKKGTKLGISLLPTGWIDPTDATQGVDIGNFLESSAFPKPSNASFFVFDFVHANIGEVKINTKTDVGPVTGTSTWRVVSITDHNMIILSPSGTAPASGDVLGFENLVATGTIGSAPVDITGAVYGLDGDLDNHKSISSKFWFDDLVYQSDGIQGGFTWSLAELPKFLFEGEGTYIKPIDVQVNTATSMSGCPTNLLLENLEVFVDGVALHDLACFEPLEVKTNVTQTKPTIPGVNCTSSITTDVQPTISITFSQIALASFPVYQMWEDGKVVDIVITYGDGTTGRNFMIASSNCTMDAAPTAADVNGVQYTSLTYNVSKPCGVMGVPNMTVAAY